LIGTPMSIARFDKRIFGWLLDEVMPLLSGIGMVFLLMYAIGPQISIFLIALIAILADYSFYVLFNSLMMLISNGYTLGMALFGIKTIHQDGQRMKARECFLKCFLTGVIPMDIVNAFYMISSHTERSAFDRMTETIVIDRRHEIE